jgi:glutamine amidotransferase-like uncharacterized protein
MSKIGIGLTAFVIIMGLAACNRQDDVSTDVSGAALPPNEKTAQPITVEAVELEILESFPVQVHARVKGKMPNGCTGVEYIQSTDLASNRVIIEVTTNCPLDNAQGASGTPFTEIIPLDLEGLPAGIYNVAVNGTSATFTLDVDNVFPIELGGASLPAAAAAVIGISLIPYANKGFHGMVPDAWTEKRPGEFARGDTNMDPTFLVQQEVPGATSELVIELLAPRLGIAVFPEPSGAFRNQQLSWELYVTESGDADAGTIKFDVALAEGADRVFLVLMGSTAEEYDDLHYGVFLPVVDALTPTSASAAAANTREPETAAGPEKAEVLLLKGEQLENNASDTVARLLESELGLSTAFIDLQHLDHTDLQDAKLIFFPGGECASVSLSSRAARRVREAVAAGTGYIGTCCGAFLAAEATSTASHIQLPADGDSFGVFPGLAEWGGGDGRWPFYIDLGHPIVANTSFADQIPPMVEMRFVGGTSNLLPSYPDGLLNWRVATFGDPAAKGPAGKRAAMTATVFGRGRVFLSGAHPEAQVSTYPLVLAAAEWCTGLSDPESAQQPVVVADIADEGIAGRFLVVSASGSHDPLGYPIGFIWDFGDGSPKQYRPEAMHIYENAGVYTITLTVTTGTRHTTISKQVAVHEP